MHSRHQANKLKAAVASNPDTFVSFSEGMATVDKFELIYDSMPSLQALPAQSQSFQSFSHGLATVDKFELINSLGAGFVKKIGSISSFAQAAELLAQLAQMSSTLSNLLTRVKDYPWLNEVAVEWKQKAQYKEFCQANHMLVLDPECGVEEMLLDLCHQLYHVGNSCHERLYGESPIEQNQFFDLMLWNETAALLTEMSLRQELSLIDSHPVQVFIVEDKNKYWLDIEQFLFEKDLQSLRSILEKSMLRGSESLPFSGKIQHEYESYIRTFKQRTSR